jgi:oleate hydratase
MLEEEAYVCLWNLLDTIPSLADPAKTAKQEIWDFNQEWHTHSGARLIDRTRKILAAADLGFNVRDRHLRVRHDASKANGNGQ